MVHVYIYSSSTFSLIIGIWNNLQKYLIQNPRFKANCSYLGKLTTMYRPFDISRMNDNPSRLSHQNLFYVLDDPKLVSSRHKDIFEDILEDRRHTSDVRWSLRTRDEPVYKNNKPRTINQIMEHVMRSDRVKFAVEQVRPPVLS